MKKNLYGLLVAFLAVGMARSGQAQQVAQHSQYMNNNYLINPAVAGTEDYIDVKFSFRQQWTGIEGAPRTYYVSANSSLGSLYTQKKRTLYDWRKGFHAIGGIIYRDETGPTSATAVYGSYTYNLALTRTMRLALGASLGVQQYAIDGSMLHYYNVNTVGVSEAARVPDASIGMWLYTPNFFVGVSTAQLLGNQLDLGYSNASNSITHNKLERHYFATLGVRLPLNDDVSIVPSVLVKYMSPAPISADFNVKLKIKDALFLGASYRTNDAFTGMVGVNFSPVASLSYSYDVGTSDLAGYNSGSHEVLLGLKLNKSRRVVCNDRFW
ncbi:MAG: PorP/SprF family type IX secretion system membrane protein [Janthinobacterium lividum]